MDIIVYDGPHLNNKDLTMMVRSCAALHNTEDVDLNIRTCETTDDLSAAIQELVALEVQSKERFFPFKSADGTHLLRLSQVLYFRSSGHRVIATLTSGKELYGLTLRLSTAALLEPLVHTGKFYRTYRSTFVNKLHIDRFGPGWVLLDNGTRLSASRKYFISAMDEEKARGHCDDMNA